MTARRADPLRLVVAAALGLLYLAMAALASGQALPALAAAERARRAASPPAGRVYTNADLRARPAPTRPESWEQPSAALQRDSLPRRPGPGPSGRWDSGSDSRRGASTGPTFVVLPYRPPPPLAPAAPLQPPWSMLAIRGLPPIVCVAGACAW